MIGQRKPRCWIQWVVFVCVVMLHGGPFFAVGEAQENGDLRLRGGTALQGRLEVYHAGQWGTVCDDRFGTVSAEVACRLLGNEGGTPYTAAGGSGPIWLDSVECQGHETSLAACMNDGWGVHDCSHDEDVGVVCSGGTLPKSTAPPPPSEETTTTEEVGEAGENGALRLRGGDARSGRLEVYHAGQWGTVCFEPYRLPQGNAYRVAGAACRQLGHAGGTPSYATGGSGPIWLDGLECRGNEARLDACRHRGWGSHGCSHAEDLAVSCDVDTRAADFRVSVTPTEIAEGGSTTVTVAITNGVTFTEPLSVALAFSGTAASSDFTVPTTLSALTLPAGGTAVTAKLTATDDAHKEGAETIVVTARYGLRRLGEATVTISASDLTTSTLLEGGLRLRGGNALRGRLEVYHAGQWGTVCDDRFGTVSAEVACRLLGNEGGTPYTAAGGSGPIWLDSVECQGHETSLAACMSDGWGVHDCSHNEDVGVVCSEASLLNSPAPSPRSEETATREENDRDAAPEEPESQPQLEQEPRLERIGTNGPDDLMGGGGDDLLIGKRGRDLLRGGRGNDELRGGLGHDELRGGRGDDELVGGPGDDELVGGRGDDELIGGDGNDTYTGGPGADRFVFSPEETGDKAITDFETGDVVVLKQAGAWPSIADIVASVVAQGDRYTVYTLLSGLTVETDRPLRAQDFVVE